MFQIYLPIAEIPINLFLVLGLGGLVGFLSGMFGVGGGFLLTPFLMFAGIPPAVAIATEANHIVASSVSGVMAYWRRRMVDFRMGGILVLGGIVGANLGVSIFRTLREAGQAELLVSLTYVVFLGIVGSVMLVESIRAIRAAALNLPGPGTGRRRHLWVHGLPLRMRFRRSGLYISVIPPIMLGFFVGFLAAIMGVGGGFIMIPAMIYILRMPTSVVVGTSLFQIIFITSLVTLLHSVQNQTVDVLLAFLLMAGGVVGAQLGVRAGVKLKGEQLRALLALLVLGVCTRLAFNLVSTPIEPFSIMSAGLP